jgi:2-dehydropantoate 2-reductase
MTAKKVVVVGAGAVGCFYGGMLSLIGGHTVTLIGRSNRCEAITRQGLYLDCEKLGIQGTADRIQTSSNYKELQNSDIILLAVKSTDTAATVAEMAPHLPCSIPIVSLQNGVDNAQRLTCVAPNNPVFPCVVYVAVEMINEHRVKHHGRGDLGTTSLK